MGRSLGYKCSRMSFTFYIFFYFFLLGTVKDNILFGKRFQQDWYDAVIDACALKDDFQQLSHGNFLLHILLFRKKLTMVFCYKNCLVIEQKI